MTLKNPVCKHVKISETEQVDVTISILVWTYIVQELTFNNLLTDTQSGKSQVIKKTPWITY